MLMESFSSLTSDVFGIRISNRVREYYSEDDSDFSSEYDSSSGELDDDMLIAHEWAILQSQTEPVHRNFIELEARHPSATHPANFKKNRYMNVLPVEEYRVVLDEDRVNFREYRLGETDGLKSDYINASYIYEGEKRYIAAMAPMNDTFDDFWQMVWEQEIVTIVMILRLTENGKIKGDRYWPENPGGTFTTENYQIAFEAVKESKDLITVRELSIAKRSDLQNRRTIYHIHYEGWPDFGVPDEGASIRDLVRTVDQISRVTIAPTLIHCSAGIGRTGTFLTIAIGIACLNSLAEVSDIPAPTESILSHTINIKDIILGLRRYRNRGMVQNEDQYRFIHHVLNEEHKDLFNRNTNTSN
eukprot:TRINITY_DN3373_c0_g1_i2.p1 TRINITY_DN3373_c0_g1~~TRINITY_DN3373_c0_g1_i2.p1  ORF type:complete len:358 (-),score=53.58 TRINITY_DN3373_c0_g1_i2:136-1209(-)